MSSSFGQYLRLSIFGQSHGPAIGITMDGLPAGMRIDFDRLARDLSRRAPGQSELSTPRREADLPEFLSGVLNGFTTGQPICVIIRSTGAHSADYGAGVDVLRPSHADYTGHIRYFGFEDWRGGGSFSGRLTAAIVSCGSLCAQWLESQDVRLAAQISRIGDLTDDHIAQVTAAEELRALREMALPVLRPGLNDDYARAILDAQAAGDSLGGCITCRVDGLPAGLGAPFFDSAESVLSHLMFSIPGVKGVSFGDGFALASLRGSEANDPFRIDQGRVVTETNRAGGINGGITNGMPLILTCALRPTPSIAQPQDTVSLRQMENVRAAIHGRHDPCIVPRAVPVVEAMTAIGLTELWKERLACLRSSPTQV